MSADEEILIIKTAEFLPIIGKELTARIRGVEKREFKGYIGLNISAKDKFNYVKKNNG
jgi:hypothetical protein